MNTFHLVQIHGNEARHRLARNRWRALYAAGVQPVQLHTFPRDARSIGDTRPLPFLKDALAVAMSRCEHDKDVVIFSNDDCWFDLSRLKETVAHASQFGAFTIRRYEPGCEYVHIGRECFCFSHEWLQEYFSSLPDYLLATPDYDLGLAALIRKTYGIDSSLGNMATDFHPAELPRGFCIHLPHKSSWDTTDVNSRPSVQHNRRLLREWAAKYQPRMTFNGNGVMR